MKPNPTSENDRKKNYAENKYKEDFNFDGREIARQNVNNNLKNAAS